MKILGSENVVEKQMGRVVRRMKARLGSLETNRSVVDEEIKDHIVSIITELHKTGTITLHKQVGEPTWNPRRRPEDSELDPNKTLAEQWNILLDSLQAYDEQLGTISARFRVAKEHGHQLVTAMNKNQWQVTQGTDELVKKLKKYFTKHTITLVEPEVINQEGQTITDAVPRFHFALLNTEWDIPVTFFDSPELASLLKLYIPLVELDAPWTLQVIGKERHIDGQGVMKLINSTRALSKPYMNVQRYKGLGEMNPEQLWETSMDKNSRTLLKVTIEDGLEADNWFTSLMGDDVAGRREYIEKYGQFVKNLDV